MVDANYTLTDLNGVSDEARNAVIVAQGTNSAVRDIIAPLTNKLYTVVNNTVGGYSIRIRAASGSAVTIANGISTPVYCDGTNFYSAINGVPGNFAVAGNETVTGTLGVTGAITATTATFSGAISSVSPAFTGTPTSPTASYGTSTTQIATTAFVQAALQAMYPVGSVYINAAVDTNPATLLGFGTWATVGDGKVIVNQDTTDTSFDTLGETGGSKDAIVVSHTHSVTDPGHTHTSYQPNTKGLSSGGDPNGVWGGGTGTLTATTSATTGISIASSGSSGTNANLQPYVVVRMWKRTA